MLVRVLPVRLLVSLLLVHLPLSACSPGTDQRVAEEPDMAVEDPGPTQSEDSEETEAMILFVRIKADLSPEEFERRLMERHPRFLEVSGLVQKIYGRDASTGDVCGIYFFESSEALDQFRESELAQTIADAYEAIEVRREAYDVLFPLRPDVGPFAGAEVGSAN